MINIEELRADIEAGTPGDWEAEEGNCDYGSGQWWWVGPYKVETRYNISAKKEEEWLADKRRAERLPQLEREYLAMREALAEMLIEFDIPAYAASDEIAACQQARKALGETQ